MPRVKTLLVAARPVPQEGPTVDISDCGRWEWVPDAAVSGRVCIEVLAPSPFRVHGGFFKGLMAKAIILEAVPLRDVTVQIREVCFDGIRSGNGARSPLDVVLAEPETLGEKEGA